MGLTASDYVDEDGYIADGAMRMKPIAQGGAVEGIQKCIQTAIFEAVQAERWAVAKTVCVAQFANLYNGSDNVLELWKTALALGLPSPRCPCLKITVEAL